MELSTAPADILDFTTAAAWPQRAAAHLLGAGLLLAVLVALPVAPTDLDRHQLPKETVVHLVTWLAVLLARPFPPAGLRPAMRWSLLGLTLITVASALTADNGWLALRAGSLIITGIAAFLTARHLAGSGTGAILLGWCTTAGIVGAAIGLAQAYGLESIYFARTRVPGGTFGNRNFMAHFAGLTLPLGILSTLTTRRRVSLILSAAGCAILTAAIVLSRSRAAWIGSLCGSSILLLTLLLASRRHALPRLGRRLLLLAAIIPAGIAVAIVLPNHLAWRSASPYSDTLTGITTHDEGSGHGRVLQYRNTVRLAMRHPVLGVGPGNWPVRYAEVAPTSDPTWVFADVVPINPWPSSDWMALLSELGPLAVVLALLLGAAVAWRGFLGGRATGDRVLAGATLLAVIATTFIEGNFDAVLLLPAPLLFVAMSTGALASRSDDQPDTGARLTDGSRMVFAVPVVLGLLTLRSVLQTTAYAVAGSGRSTQRLAWAAHIDPGSYPIRIALAQRRSCPEAKADIAAALDLAPNWPATITAARRCGVPIPTSSRRR